MVISEETFKHAVQMSLVEHNEVVEALPPEGADEPLHIRRLPRRVGRECGVIPSPELG
jgi:hypothetical protein